MTDIVKKTGLRDAVQLDVSEGVADALEDKVQRIVSEAEERAEENDRKTLMERDI